MYKGKSVLGLITARGGSKRLPEKHILPFLGKPLIAWTIESAANSKYIDRFILSSDDSAIIDAAKRYGCEVPFVRPSHLATDESSSADVVIHAMESLDRQYDYAILLQPTSPLRTTQHIDECIEKCIDENSRKILSVSQANNKPTYFYCLIRDNRVVPIFGNDSLNTPPPKFFVLNGAIYMFRTDYFFETKTFMDNETSVYVMPMENSIDIDTLQDFKLAEYLAGSAGKQQG